MRHYHDYAILNERHNVVEPKYRQVQDESPIVHVPADRVVTEMSQLLVANPKFKGWPDIVQLRAYYIPKKGKAMNEKYYNAIPQTAPSDPYSAHQSAAAEWSEACHAYSQAAQRKELAAKRLQEAASRLAEVLQATAQDPTIPQERPHNGQLGVAGQMQQLR